MLNFAINVHHNVTQFPQDLTPHKTPRPTEHSHMVMVGAKEAGLRVGIEMELGLGSGMGWQWQWRWLSGVRQLPHALCNPHAQ